MHILVTGGAGFIGSHLCTRLINDGHAVYCIDNLITGSEKNIERLQSNADFTFLNFDITKDAHELVTVIEKEIGQSFTIDQIYHLASPASPVQYHAHPLETLKVNSVGTEHMLELAKEYNAKFLFASTSEVYGDPKEHPQKETYWGNVNSFGPRSCYDEAKRYGEAVCYTYLTQYELDVRIVRIFNTYGPNMQAEDGRIISNFVVQCLSGKSITVYGDGNQTRSFCYVTDLVEGLIKLINSENTKGEVINLGNPQEKTVLEIAELIKKLTNSSSEIMFHNLPVDDPIRRNPDIRKAQKLLNWSPKITLEDGLSRTIEYFKTIR